MISTYDRWRLEVLVVVARKGAPARTVPLDGAVDETRRRLAPSRWASLARRARFRQLPTLGGLRRRVMRYVRPAGGE
jgi:hypothetical protein